jgi:ATP-dependent helicase/nuclease subunit B
VDLLYGRQLTTSVSALEDYSACPFKFYVARGLGAKERELYEPDVRELGSFQHELLRVIHERLLAEKTSWRDLVPADADRLAGELGRQLAVSYRGGLFQTSAEARFVGAQLVEGIRSLFHTLIGWMPQYLFDPVEVELGFGMGAEGLPGWGLELEDGRSLRLRGRIDRIDICRSPENNTALAVVIDYKSSRMQLDPVKLQHGLQLQLLSYLGVLENLTALHARLGVGSLEPAGVFYVSLKPPGESQPDEVSAQGVVAGAALEAYQHRGRFNRDHLEQFDTRGSAAGDQFKYALKKDGGWKANYKDPMSRPDFLALKDQVRDQLTRIGNEIFQGRVQVEPYQIKKERACDRCEFQAVCRFDPWTDAFRVLRAESAQGD